MLLLVSLKVMLLAQRRGIPWVTKLKQWALLKVTMTASMMVFVMVSLSESQIEVLVYLTAYLMVYLMASA